MITVTEVAEHLRLGDATDDAALGRAVDAANAYVGSLPHVIGVDPWPGTVHYGAIMLASKLYRRRNTPAGVEAFGDAGVAYVTRGDSDLERMLRIGRAAPPRVG